jgi:hypothetical protein
VYCVGTAFQSSKQRGIHVMVKQFTIEEIIEGHRLVIEQTRRGIKTDKIAELIQAHKSAMSKTSVTQPATRSVASSSRKYSTEHLIAAHNALYGRGKQEEPDAKPLPTYKKPSGEQPQPRLTQREKEELLFKVAEEQPDNGLIQALRSDIQRRKMQAATAEMRLPLNLKKAYGGN